MDSKKKVKSFLYTFTWVGGLLLFIGLALLTVGIVIQFIPMQPENITAVVDGVRQPATEASIKTFRLIFLLAFGLVGLILTIAGTIVVGRTLRKNKLAKHLKENGVRVLAQWTENSPSSVRVNNRQTYVLRCIYAAPGGQTYIFKSGHLRMDPVPYLTDGQVYVYHAPDDIGRYFVDVDGSTGMGNKLVEL